MQIPEVAAVFDEMEGKTTREKVLLIVRAICDKYQYGGDGPWTPIGSDCYNIMWSDDRVYSGVCAQFMRAVMHWCNIAGIPCFFMGSDTHDWNEVYLVEENKWVAVDATWADESTAGGNFDKYAITNPAEHYQEVAKEPYPKDNDAAIVAREIMELGMKLRNKAA